MKMRRGGIARVTRDAGIEMRKPRVFEESRCVHMPNLVNTPHVNLDLHQVDLSPFEKLIAKKVNEKEVVQLPRLERGTSRSTI